MSRQFRSLNLSLSYPSNFQRQSFCISLSDLTSSPLPSYTTSSPRMDSDYSTNTVYNTITQFNNSDFETTVDFQNSEPTRPLFRNPLSTYPDSNPQREFPSPSSFTNSTSTFSPMTSDQPDPSSHLTEDLEHEVDNFITSKQQLQNINTLTIRNLAHRILFGNFQPSLHSRRNPSPSSIQKKTPKCPRISSTPTTPIDFTSPATH